MRSLVGSTVVVLAVVWASGDAVARQWPAKPKDARSKAAELAPCEEIGESAPAEKIEVLGVGGSSMHFGLGPILVSRLDRAGIEAEKNAKSATGLARPDFFDWPAHAAKLLKKSDPDVVVVALGGNDTQSLSNADKSKWWKRGKKGWEEEYGRRVDAFLALLAGEELQRSVIWLGPLAHTSDKGFKYSKKVSKVIRERVEAFAGRAWFIDLHGRTSTASGEPLTKLRVGKKTYTLRADDGLHLKRRGVKALMLEPVMALLEPCVKLAKAAKDAKKGVKTGQ